MIIISSLLPDLMLILLLLTISSTCSIVTFNNEWRILSVLLSSELITKT